MEVKRKVLLKKDANITLSKEILVVEKVEYVFNSIEDAFYADNTKMTDNDLEKISDGDIITLYFPVCFFKWQIQGRLQTLSISCDETISCLGDNTMFAENIMAIVRVVPAVIDRGTVIPAENDIT